MRSSEPKDGESRTSDDLRAIVAGVRDVVALELRRLQLRVTGAVLRGAMAVLLLTTCVAIAIAAGLLIAAGTRDLIARWTGAVWSGELSAGILLLGGMALVIWIARAIVCRRIVVAALRTSEARADAPTDESAAAGGESEAAPEPAPGAKPDGEEAT